MENAGENVLRVCRACKSENGNMLSLFEETECSGQKIRVHEMLMSCAAVQFDGNDNLPKQICNACVHKLKIAYEFKKQCETIDQQLRENSVFILQTEDDLLHTIFYKNEEIEVQQNEKSKGEYDLPHTMFPEVVMQDQTCKSDFIEFLENNQLMLTCRICLKIFSSVDGLKCHKRLHTGDLYKCKHCGKAYNRSSHLLRHELTHGRRKFHVCKICNKTLTRFEHLKRHLVIHLKEKPYSCTNCNRGFTRTDHVLKHIKKCKGQQMYICDICSKAYNREDSLEVHKRLHENKMPVLPTLDNLDNIEEHYYEIDCDDSTFPSYSEDSDDDNEEDLLSGDDMEDIIKEGHVENVMQEDEDCGDNVRYEMTINTHLDEMPQEHKPNLLELQQSEHSDNMLNNDDNDQNCDDNEGYEEPTICFEEVETPSHLFIDPVSLEEGKSKRGRGRPRRDDAKQSSRKRKQVMVKKEDGYDDNDSFIELTCPNCEKIFKKANLLQKHLIKCAEEYRLSSSEQEYECDICQKTFLRPDILVRHKIAKHNDLGEKFVMEKKYKCNYCAKSFTTEKYRDVHMKGHLGEKKYTCKTCEKSFLSKSHLTEHMKFHNENSKKYLCSECGQRFIRNDYLVIHMRRHRGEKPFKCKYCGKGFPRTTDLTVHERYHTGEKTHLCTVCGRGFGRAYNLTVHMRTHTGEKPYQCTYCDAAFAQGNDLKAHIRRHTGERFHCDMCSETFLMGYLLTHHKRHVHGLNIVSNIRRLQTTKTNPDEPPPITVPLPQPIVPATIPVEIIDEAPLIAADLTPLDHSALGSKINDDITVLNHSQLGPKISDDLTPLNPAELGSKMVA